MTRLPFTSRDDPDGIFDVTVREANPPLYFSHYDENDEHPLVELLPPEPDFPDEDITTLADLENRSNIVYVKGVAYKMYDWSEPDEAGNRSAQLRLWRPF